MLAEAAAIVEQFPSYFQVAIGYIEIAKFANTREQRSTTFWIIGNVWRSLLMSLSNRDREWRYDPWLHIAVKQCNIQDSFLCLWSPCKEDASRAICRTKIELRNHDEEARERGATHLLRLRAGAAQRCQTRLYSSTITYFDVATARSHPSWTARDLGCCAAHAPLKAKGLTSRSRNLTPVYSVIDVIVCDVCTWPATRNAKPQSVISFIVTSPWITNQHFI